MSGRTSPGQAAFLLRLDRVLGATLAALAAPAVVLAAPAAGAQTPAFHAPTRPLLLTREVHRTLADGQQLVVRRHYRIHILPRAGGFTVTGDLAGVEVEAPAALAEMAEVERQRSDAGLFPLDLDAAGQIVARPAPAETVDAARARTAMAAYLARTDLTAQQRATAQGLALRLQSQYQAAGNVWPADLFRPAPGPRREQRALPLPDGRSGDVVVTVDATNGPGGLLSRMERRTVTRLDGTERLSLERYTLTDAR